MKKINNTKELGMALKYRRLEFELSQNDVAKDCGVVYQTVGSAERGREVSVRNFVKMCDKLQLRIVLVPVDIKNDLEY